MMDSEKLVFLLENKKTKKNIYQHELELIEFQRQTIGNENVSFYYTFKDAGIDLEEQIALKIKSINSDGEILFTIKYLDKILYSSTLEGVKLDDADIKKNEVNLYFIFEKVCKIITDKISEEHKNIILSNIENK